MLHFVLAFAILGGGESLDVSFTGEDVYANPFLDVAFVDEEVVEKAPEKVETTSYQEAYGKMKDLSSFPGVTPVIFTRGTPEDEELVDSFLEQLKDNGWYGPTPALINCQECSDALVDYWNIETTRLPFVSTLKRENDKVVGGGTFLLPGTHDQFMEFMTYNKKLMAVNSRALKAAEENQQVGSWGNRATTPADQEVRMRRGRLINLFRGPWGAFGTRSGSCQSCQ